MSLQEKIIHVAHLTPGETYAYSGGTFRIDDDLPPNTHLIIDGNLRIEGSVGDRSKIQASGYVDIMNNIKSSVTIEGASIYAHNVGPDCDLHATHNDIKVNDLASTITLAAAGNISFSYAGDYIHATAGRNLEFEKVGNTARLMGANISGEHTGDNATLIASEGQIRLTTLGNRAAIFTAGICAISINEVGDHVSMGNYVPDIKDKRMHHIGCGIQFDILNKRYLIPDDLRQKYGESYDQLMSTLAFEHKAKPKIESAMWVNQNGVLRAGHWITPDGAHAEQLRTRHDVMNFVSVNEKIR